jgi:hypothetical protein
MFALCAMCATASAQNATPFKCRREPPPPSGLLGLPACDSQLVINEIVRTSKPGFAISGVQAATTTMESQMLRCAASLHEALRVRSDCFML